MPHCYHDLPAPLRGSALESHSGWPVRWPAPDGPTALRVSTALLDTLRAGGMSPLFDVMVVGDSDSVVVSVNRKETA